MSRRLLDAAAFRRALDLLEAAIYNNAHQALVMSVQAAEESATHTTLYNDRSGYLRQHTKGSVQGLEGRLVADAGWAGYVENGTRPHDIVARGGGVLAFQVAGEQRFARRVHHPGTAARPFMQEARDIGEKTLDYGMELFVGTSFERG